MSYNTVSVGTSQSEVVAANTGTPRRIAILLYNNSSTTIYLGDDTSVTTSNGYPLLNGDELVIDFRSGIPGFFYRGAIHAIAGSASNDLRYWEMKDVRGTG